jgi:SAM-dependent methyltransferase
VPRRDRRSASCGQTRNSFPLRDETVDAVVSIAVLELVPDPAAALAEMARLLRPGGQPPTRSLDAAAMRGHRPPRRTSHIMGGIKRGGRRLDPFQKTKRSVSD